MKISTLFGSLILVCLLAPSYATQWNGGNGNWSTAASWAGGVGPTLTAEIIATGAYNLTVDVAVNLNTITVGGTGSNPTLILDGVVVNTAALAFNSGRIVLTRGAKLVTSQISVAAATATAVIESVNGTVNLLAYSVSSGVLQLIGSIDFDTTFTVSAGAEVVLSGTHSAGNTWSVGGTGKLTVDAGATLSFSGLPSIFGTLRLVGGIIQKTANNSFGLLTTAQAEVDTAADKSVIAANILVTGGLNLISGAIQTIQGAIVTVKGNVSYATNQTFNLAANIVTDVGTLLVRGNQLIQNVTISANATVEAGATLSLDTVIYAHGTITNFGNIVITKAVQLGQQVNSTTVIVGGQVTALLDSIIVNGTVILQQTVVTGNATVNTGCALILQGANYTKGKVQGAGTLVINGASSVVALAQDSVVFSQASFSNQGSLAVQSGSLSFEDSTQVNGQIAVNPAAALTFAGNVVVNAKANITGNVNIIKGAVSSLVGGLVVYGNTTVQNAAQLASTSASVLIFGSLSVSGSSRVNSSNDLEVALDLVIGDNSVLYVNGGKSTSRTVTLSASSTYEVAVSSATSAVLQVAGLANINGQLLVDLTAGFNLQAGTSVTVMNYGSHQGQFSQVSSNPNPPANQQYIVNYQQNEAQVSSTGTTNSQQVPASASTVLEIALVTLLLMILSLL